MRFQAFVNLSDAMPIITNVRADLGIVEPSAPIRQACPAKPLVRDRHALVNGTYHGPPSG
jgi:hypothetical protein